MKPENAENLKNQSEEELCSLINFNMQNRVKVITIYYQLLDCFKKSLFSFNLSQNFIDYIDAKITKINEIMIYWYSIQEEKLKRKLSQDKKYRAIQDIYDQLMLVSKLTVIKAQAVRQNRIKMNLSRLVRDKSEEAKQQMTKIEQIVKKQQEGTSADPQQPISYYTLVSLREAISTIKDLKWTIEGGNEDIYEDLKEELKGNLLKLVEMIEENLKRSRSELTSNNDIGETDQAFRLICEIQTIADIIGIKLPDIKIDEFIPEIETNLDSLEKFLTNKGMIQKTKESELNLSLSDQSLALSDQLLKKSECEKLNMFYTFIKTLKTKTFLIDKIDKIRKLEKKQEISLQIKSLNVTLDEFIKNQMEKKVKPEFNNQLNLMKLYLKKVSELVTNKDGLFENKDHQNKASEYITDLLSIPVDNIINIFRMIRELKSKYHILWSKLSQNDDYEEEFKRDISRFYKGIEESIARVRNDQVHITNNLNVINQLIPLDPFVNDQNDKSKEFFQAKYDEHFKGLCNFNETVVTQVEGFIQGKKYDEIKNIIITISQLGGLDQQINMRQIQQKLQQRCSTIRQFIAKQSKFLIKGKHADPSNTETINNESNELKEILEKIGQRFLGDNEFEKAQQELQNVQKKIQSDFNLLSEQITNQIDNQRYTEAYTSIQNYFQTVKNIDFPFQEQTQTGKSQINPDSQNQAPEESKDYISQYEQLDKRLKNAIDSKVDEFANLEKQIDDQKLEKLIALQPKEILDNLQKNLDQELFIYSAKTIKTCAENILSERRGIIEAKVGKKGQNGQQVLDEINNYFKHCAKLPEEMQKNWQEQITKVQEKYINGQKEESTLIQKVIEDAKDNIDKVYDQVSKAQYTLASECRVILDDFYKSHCEKALEKINHLIIKIL